MIDKPRKKYLNCKLCGRIKFRLVGKKTLDIINETLDLQTNLWETNEEEVYRMIYQCDCGNEFTLETSHE